MSPMHDNMMVVDDIAYMSCAHSLATHGTLHQLAILAVEVNADQSCTVIATRYYNVSTTPSRFENKSSTTPNDHQ